ncbi:hypothetical protein ILUMI_25791 [Ignelater luminosus]|uniref:Mutator-like transposase domain-containing protein n=1 Tax=Ignelater luminosus TaxID=2038154 RepID=A0A8K0CAZ4_IGNLU|nr:hypothetical protein ILUMI_25791 [Ignelater luminosus]
MYCSTKRVSTNNPVSTDINAAAVPAMKSIKEAGREKSELAKKYGEVDKDGIRVITVVADGAWCKWSYKTNYTASSGAIECHGEIHKAFTNKSPGAHTKRYAAWKTRSNQNQVCRRLTNKKARKEMFVSVDNDYGTTTSNMCRRTSVDLEAIEKRTVGQNANPEWLKD